MAAHLWWRILAVTANGNPIAAAEIEMRGEIGGADLCNGGTPKADSYYGGGYEIARAFDGTTSTVWASQTAAGGWIGYLFAAPVEIVEVAWTARPGYGEQTPGTAKLQYSDDGATWSDAFPIVFGKFASGETKVRSAPLPPPVGVNPHLWWRVYHNATGDYVCALNIELRASPGGSDLGPTYVIESKDPGHYADWTAARAFDGDLATTYGSDGNSVGYAAAKFSGPTTIEEIAWTIRQQDNYQVPKTGHVDYSDDGVTWSKAWDFSFTGNWPSATAKVATNPDYGLVPIPVRRKQLIVVC